MNLPTVCAESQVKSNRGSILCYSADWSGGDIVWSIGEMIIGKENPINSEKTWRI